MAYFVVNYDLKEGQDYKPLTDELKRLSAVRSLESFWLIDLNNTQAEVLEHFKNFLPDQKNDKLMIVQFYARPSFTRAFSPTNEWLAEHFPT
jgi:hypothetical protein